MPIIGLFVLLILACLAFWAARAILAAFGIGDPVATLVYVAIVVIVVVGGLSMLGVLPGMGLRLR